MTSVSHVGAAVFPTAHYSRQVRHTPIVVAMMKVLAFIASCITITLLFAGCGSGHPAAVPTRTPPVLSIAAPAGVKPGEEFVATIQIANVLDLGGYQVTLEFDAAKVSVVSEDDGALLSSTGRTPICNTKTKPASLDYVCVTTEPKTTQGTATGVTPGPSGDGELVRVHMRAGATAPDVIELGLSGVIVVDPQGAKIESSSGGAQVKIQ